MAHRQIVRRLLSYTTRTVMRSSALLPSHSSAVCLRQRALSSRLFPACTVGFHTSLVQRSEHIVNIQDEADFKKQVLSNTTPVVVDFHASWCGPCKLLGPRLESLVAGKEGKIILAKVDVDDHGEIAMDHQVEAVPTVLGVKDGKVVDKFVGLKDDADLENFVNKLIGA